MLKKSDLKKKKMYDCGACMQNLREYSKVEMHIAVDQRILCQKPVHVNPVDIGASV